MSFSIRWTLAARIIDTPQSSSVNLSNVLLPLTRIAYEDQLVTRPCRVPSNLAKENLFRGESSTGLPSFQPLMRMRGRYVRSDVNQSFKSKILFLPSHCFLPSSHDLQRMQPRWSVELVFFLTLVPRLCNAFDLAFLVQKVPAGYSEHMPCLYAKFTA